MILKSYRSARSEDEAFALYALKGPECWVWRGPTRNEYGVLSVQVAVKGGHVRRRVYAHRVAYRRAHGSIPEGLVVRHLCHNRRCVNPAHLAVGTQAENMNDSVKAGRIPRGEAKARTLTVDAVYAMKRILALDLFTQKQIARWFGVTDGAVRKILRGALWRHVP